LKEKNLLIDINQRPKLGQWIVLSLQHVFAMFGATVLVPLLTGLNVGVALVASGVGTLIYILCTKGKVPVYLGSSFAYISVISIAGAAGLVDGTGFDGAFVGLMIVGLIYMAVALIIRFVGSAWLKKLLPPVVIGPMIMIIGLSLAGVAISSAGLDGSGSYTDRELSKVELKTEDYYTYNDLGEVNGYITSGNIYYFQDDSDSVFVYSVDTETSSLFSDSEEILNVYSENPATTENSDEVISTIYVELDSNGHASIYHTNGSWIIPLVALITFVTVVGVAIFSKGFFKIVPFLFGILGGYIAAMVFGLVPVEFALGFIPYPDVFAGFYIFQIPEFTFLGTYELNFSAILMFAPLAFVTINKLSLYSEMNIEKLF